MSRKHHEIRVADTIRWKKPISDALRRFHARMAPRSTSQAFKELVVIIGIRALCRARGMTAELAEFDKEIKKYEAGVAVARLQDRSFPLRVATRQLKYACSACGLPIVRGQEYRDTNGRTPIHRSCEKGDG